MAGTSTCTYSYKYSSSMFELGSILLYYSDSLLTLIIGSPALTSRGLKENGFEKVITLLHRAILIAEDINMKSGNLRTVLLSIYS